MHALDLKIPPVVLLLADGILMWLLSVIMPAFKIVIPGRIFLALALATSGAFISALGVWSFRRTKTTVNPTKPESASSLVSSGVYAVSRNPMYLGFLLVLAGWVIFLSHAASFLMLPAFVLYMNRFQIEAEESALTRLFGNEFVAYKSRVHRWL